MATVTVPITVSLTIDGVVVSAPGTATIPAPVPGTPGTSPTAASVAAVLAATPSFVAAVAAAIAPPVVTPPVVVPPPSTGLDPSFIVMTSGVFKWDKNFNYGGITETDGVTFAGQACTMFTGVTPGGGGGWNPVKNVFFNTTGYNFLQITLAPSRAGQSWQLNQPETPVNGVNDTPVPGANSVTIENYGPKPVVGVFATYKIPLHAGGLNMVAGQLVWKFGVQDQINASGANTALGSGNQWYVADCRFTV